MSRFYAERVGFKTASTGNTGDIAIGGRIAPSFRIPSETSITTGRQPVLLVQENDDFMVAEATYTVAPALAIDAVLLSVIGGVVGTTRMSLGGDAEIRFLPPIAKDLEHFFIRTDIDQAGLAVPLTAAQKAQAQKNIGLPAIMRNYKSGMTLSPSGASMSVGPGVVADGTNLTMINLASAFSKTTSAWAAGSGNGGLDVGTVANNTTYHWYAMERPDTGAVEFCFSLSASAPTTTTRIPVEYTRFRKIGSRRTNGSAQWIDFVQVGDEVLYTAPVLEANNVAVPTSATLRTLVGIPTGVKVMGKFRAFVGAPGSAAGFLVQSPDETAAIPFATVGNATLYAPAAGAAVGQFEARTNTSAQFRWASDGTLNAFMVTRGFIDRAGQDD